MKRLFKVVVYLGILLGFASIINADLSLFPPIGTSQSLGIIIVTQQPGTDICAQFNNAMTASYNSTPPMAPVYWPPGIYRATSQCLIPQLASNLQSDTSAVLNIWAYGVTLYTTGVLNGINIQFDGNGSKGTLYGLTVANDNASQVNGFDMGRVADFTCEDCKYINVSTVPVNPLSIGMRIGNSTLGNDATYTQSARIIRPKIVCYSSTAYLGGGTRVQKGISIQRANNVLVSSGTIGGCLTQILLTDDPTGGVGAGTGSGPDEVNIIDNDIEATQNGVQSYANLGAAISFNFTNDLGISQVMGVNILGNTFDNVNIVFDMTNAPPEPFLLGPYMNGNTIVADNIQYINNPKGQPYISYDNYTTARHSTRGMYYDSLAVGPSSLQGIQGSVKVNQLANPSFTVAAHCTVGGGETCSTKRCYRMADMDYTGFIGSPTAGELCANSGPDTLTLTNVMYVSPTIGVPGAAAVGVAGWRIYGRTTGAELYMTSGLKSINGVTASLLASDPGLTPTTLTVFPFPTFVDNGTVTPSGALPTINNTGVLATTLLQVVPTTFVALPACAAGTKGYRAIILDDNAACTFGTAASGGGAAYCPVGCDGASYKAGY